MTWHTVSRWLPFALLVLNACDGSPQSRWTIYPMDGPICYARANATRLEPSSSSREAYLQLNQSTFSRLGNSLFVIPGYNYAPGTKIMLIVDEEERFDFQNDRIKSLNRDEDQQRLFSAILAGREVVVMGTSEDGMETSDRFGLDGIDEAYAEISRLCEVEPLNP